MKKMWETGIILFAAMGFWGMIYPDLCFTEDVCINISETNSKSEEYEADIYTQICEASPDQIHIKSKFLDSLFGEKGKSEESAVENDDTMPHIEEKELSKEESKGKSNVSYKGYQYAQ